MNDEKWLGPSNCEVRLFQKKEPASAKGLGSTLRIRETEEWLEWWQPRQQMADVCGRKVYRMQSFVGHRYELGFYSESDWKLL